MTILIVGAGPIGCYSGYLLAKNGYDVHIYESRKNIGEPMQCTGLVTKSIYDVVDFPKKFIINHIKKAELNCKSTKAYIPINDLVIDRIGFDKYFADLAVKAGAKIHLKQYVNEISKNYIVSNNKKIKFDMLIGADGPESIVSMYIGNYLRYYIGVQMRIDSSFDNQIFKTYFGNEFTDFFGWVVPETSKTARIGLASKKNPNQLLDLFTKKFKGKLIDRQGGLIPIFNPNITLQINNIYIVGDAAGMVKPTTGGGLVQGMKGAQLLAKSIIENQDYTELCNRYVFPDLRMSLRIRKYLNKFNDRDWIDLINKMKDKKVQKILQNNTRDKPFQLMSKLILTKPSLAKYGFLIFR